MGSADQSGPFSGPPLCEQRMLVPVTGDAPVSQVLSLVVKNCAKAGGVPDLRHVKITKIFVHDNFEIVDHQSLVSNCFDDYSQVTIHAFKPEAHSDRPAPPLSAKPKKEAPSKTKPKTGF